MSPSDANAAAECNHSCWVYEENYLINIRHGSTVWLRPVSSRWGDGTTWWTCVHVGNPNAPRGHWGALQVVWGMEACRKENDGILVRPEDVEKWVRAELAKQDVDTATPACEGMSGKVFLQTSRWCWSTRLIQRMRRPAVCGAQQSIRAAATAQAESGVEVCNKAQINPIHQRT
jgi:hypothetical protein